MGYLPLIQKQIEKGQEFYYAIHIIWFCIRN